MTQNWYWADRGRHVEITPRADPGLSSCIGVSRMGSLRVQVRHLTLLVQLRGHSRVQALEGQFRLRAGDWLVVDRDSRPNVQASASGLCIGLSISLRDLQAAGSDLARPLYVGRGVLAVQERRMVMRLWRQAMEAAFRFPGQRLDTSRLMTYFSELQRDIHRDAGRCPGRTRAHRQEVFSRLQRTRLFMEGHRGQPVRSTELASLANLSACYYSRTFTAVYGERPQATAARLRLEYAAELLVVTTDPIASVALAAGFENCCSFARAFRAQFGVTASRFRSDNTLNGTGMRRRTPRADGVFAGHPAVAAASGVPEAR
jgi:AraC family transcriptional regulator